MCCEVCTLRKVGINEQRQQGLQTQRPWIEHSGSERLRSMYHEVRYLGTSWLKRYQ